MIIGLTGRYASGKGEVAKYLHNKKGFALFSLSDVLREEVKARGLEATRSILIQVGQDLRQEEGSGVLAKRLLSRLTGRDIVDSIRHPDEISVLKSHDRVFVIGVDALSEVRFERLKARQRAGDSLTYEEFVRQEGAEDTRKEFGQQLTATFALADAVVDNSGDRKKLEEQIERLIKKKLF